jgi:hypothetical protein
MELYSLTNCLEKAQNRDHNRTKAIYTRAQNSNLARFTLLPPFSLVFPRLFLEVRQT